MTDATTGRRVTEHATDAVRNAARYADLLERLHRNALEATDTAARVGAEAAEHQLRELAGRIWAMCGVYGDIAYHDESA